LLPGRQGHDWAVRRLARGDGEDMKPNSILSCIGNTPLMELEITHEGTLHSILCKAEFMNPTGSVKDRIAAYLLQQAEKRGELKKDSVIVEMTSGNTGIALAQAAAVMGYRLIILMPEHMSSERVRLLQNLGAEVCLTPQAEGFPGAMERLEEMVRNSPAAFCPRQFENPDNVNAHYDSTGPEIWRQVGGRVDAFVAGVGTGGTLMGVGKYLREHNPKVEIIPVEPAEAAVMTGEKNPGPHKIAGIGDAFIPPIMDMGMVNHVEVIASDDAIEMSKRLNSNHGLMVGISAGANVLSAIRTQKRLGNGKRVVTILPDRSERYFSTDLYQREVWPVLHRCQPDCDCRVK
jgi:cysteine synthase A